MDISRNSCRLCLSETEFNVSLFGTYSRRTRIVDKILVCLKVVIDDSDPLTTLCYKCASNVERYYDFITLVKKGQNRLKFSENEHTSLLDESFGRRHVTSYVREQVVDADYTFSFLELPEEKKEKSSSPFFSYFSPGVLAREGESKWKSPRTSDKKRVVRDNCDDRPCSKKKVTPRRRNCSRDMFETQSQEEEQKALDWKLTPDDNIIKRVREKIFGRSGN